MILMIFGFLLVIIIVSMIIILTSTTNHILKNGTHLEKETGIKKFISKITGWVAAIFGGVITAFIRLTMWVVDKDWWFKGPFRRLFPWLLANSVVKIAYAGEVYTTEETVALLENIYKNAEKREKNGEHLHISISPCVCRHATNNWSDEMPNLTCIHFQFAAESIKKALDQTLLISADTAIHLVKDYASKWPFVHIIYGICPSGPEYFDKQIALCFCHHHCVCIRCELKRGKYGIHPIKKADHLALITENLCKSCGICYEKCPFFAIKKLENNKFQVDNERCFGCGVCTRFCPNDAIRLIDRPKSEEHFIKKEVLKLKNY